MGKRSSFFRMNYESAQSLADIIRSNTLPECARPIAEDARPGEFVLAARYNPDLGLGEVRAIGRIVKLAGAELVDWVSTQFDLEPRGIGRNHWRARPTFNFDPDVAQRYQLAQRCQAIFPTPNVSGTTQHLANPRSPAASDGGPGEERPGYVYLIESPLGYKIGRSKRPMNRARHFAVNLPFPTKLMCSGWFGDCVRKESALHRLYASKRLHGEWFALDQADVADVRMELDRSIRSLGATLPAQ